MVSADDLDCGFCNLDSLFLHGQRARPTTHFGSSFVTDDKRRRAEKSTAFVRPESKDVLA